MHLFQKANTEPKVNYNRMEDGVARGALINVPI